jgi:broad specificity phosphatase PhoE
MRLVLCRHAAAGDTRQAAELADALADVELAAAYTSPLARAAETAQAVAARHGLTPSVVDGLREIDLGEVDGLQFEDYPPELRFALLHTPGTVRFPGGESYEDLRARVVAALGDIRSRHAGESVVAISHAGAIRAALATWLEVPAEASFRVDQSFAAVNVVEWIDGAPFVRLVNGTSVAR